jgi:hypothetical protein
MRHIPRTALTVIAMLTGASCSADTPKEAGETARSIEGIYVLYRFDTPDGILVCKMGIAARQGSDFRIYGVDQSWSGEGRIEGSTGYYHWVFVTGQRGKTTFTINPDGTLIGNVQGGVTPWTYLALPSKNKAEGR